MKLKKNLMKPNTMTIRTDRFILSGKLGPVALALSVALLAIAPPLSAGPEIVQVTDNDRLDAFPRVAGRHVVWQTHDGNDWEIAYWRAPDARGDAVGPLLLTDNAFDDTDPVVAEAPGGEARLAWFRFDGGDDEIYLHDTGSGATHRVSNNRYDDRYPHMAGDLLVWQGGTGDDGEIFVHRISDGTTVQITSNGQPDRNPRTDGDVVVWRGDPGKGAGRWAIYTWGAATGRTEQLTGAGAGCWSPIVDGRWCAWHCLDDGDMEVYLHDALTDSAAPVTLNREDDSPIALDGGRLLWRTAGPNVSMPGHNFLNLLDIATGDVRVLAIAGATEIHDFVLRGDWVAYSSTEDIRINGKRIEDDEIYLHYIPGNTTFKLTDNFTPDRFATLGDGFAIWIGTDGNDSEVMMTRLTPPAEEAKEVAEDDE